MSGYETLSANSQNIKKFQLQQKARSFLVVLAIGIPVFLAMLAYLYYQDATQRNATTSTNQADESIASSDSTSTGFSDPSTQPIDGSTIAPSTTPNSAASPITQAPATTNQPSANTIPSGVQTAMNSIEASGIKGNPYVASNLDTSSVPSGTSITFDRKSWSQYSDTLGSVNAAINAYGQARTGSVTFGITEGTWKATGYSIN